MEILGLELDSIKILDKTWGNMIPSEKWFYEQAESMNFPLYFEEYESIHNFKNTTFSILPYNKKSILKVFKRIANFIVHKCPRSESKIRNRYISWLKESIKIEI